MRRARVARLLHLPSVEFDGNKFTNSPTCAYTAALLACVVCSLIVAVPLHTAGYNWRVDTNAALVKTQCTVASFVIRDRQCSERCNCYETCSGQTCTTSSGGTQRSCKPDCRRRCDTCYYTCYEAFWNVTYSAKRGGADTATTATTNLSYLLRQNARGREYRYFDDATSALARERPVGQVFVCHYDARTRVDVVTEPYSPVPFLVFAVCFYALACVACVACVLCSFALVAESCRCARHDRESTGGGGGGNAVPATLPRGQVERKRRRSKSRRSLAPPPGGAAVPPRTATIAVAPPVTVVGALPPPPPRSSPYPFVAAPPPPPPQSSPYPFVATSAP